MIFIVDTYFESLSYHLEATKYVKRQFKELSDQDYFGYISLGKNFAHDQIQLEKKERNTKLKEGFIQMMYNKNHENLHERVRAKQKRLETVLKEAMRWQEEIQDKEVRKQSHGHAYLKPHKWIVCLIGSDAYSVKDFITAHGAKVREKKNLNISILGLSGEPFDMEHHGNHYKELTMLTRKGVYLNIVDK